MRESFFDMGEADPVGLINSVQSLSHTDREKILGGNAIKLLKIQTSGGQ